MKRVRQFVDLGLRYPEPPPVDTRPAVASPYLTTREAVVYLRLGSASAIYDHIRENGLPVCRLGRNLRFDKRELDAWMRNELHLLPSKRRRA